MRAVVQRVRESRVVVDGQTVGEIGSGFLVLIGIAGTDDKKDADYLAEKIIHLRIFEDENGKMNRSLVDVKGEMLIVSQFTLLGDCCKGRRPSFVAAASPEKANELYLYFVEQVRNSGIHAETGQFRAMMDVSLVNNGPVTLVLDSRETKKSKAAAL